MATSKTPAKKKPSAKQHKSATKKAPTKTHTTTVRTVKTAKTPEMKSFKVARGNQPFVTFRITQQTIYWFILGVVVLLFGLWVVDVNDKIQHLYDQIDQINVETDAMPVIPSEKQSSQ